MILPGKNIVNAPIGVFDSGLGGLTVVRCIEQSLPNETIVYVADQAHVPYGGRDLQEVCSFALGISDGLLAYGCKALVMACNISTATALTAVQRLYPGIPILGVIAPGSRAAFEATRNRRVGVLATQGTVKSKAYSQSLLALSPEIFVVEVACPDFVPLVESGELQSPATLDACRKYLQPLVEACVDTIILGCTHYPYLLPALRDVSPEFEYIDPADETVRELSSALCAAGLTSSKRSRPNLLTTTGSIASFTISLKDFLPNSSCTSLLRQSHWHKKMVAFEEQTFSMSYE